MKRTLAMLLALLMIVGLMPMQIFADETVAEETVVVAEAAEEQIAEEIVVEETAAEETETEEITAEAAAEEILEITDEAIVVSDAFAAEAEEIPDPVLGYVHLYSPGDNSWKVQDWDLNQHNGIMGWPHMGTAPWENFLIFYLNTWNTETGSWDHQPVHVNFGKYLSGSLMKDGDYSFMPGAKDTDYYYRMDVSADGWDKTTQVTYNHNGKKLSVEVDIRRNEDGWYTSETMRNDTYILGNYTTNQLDPESNVIYFGFQSEYWTLKSADFSANHVQIVGYDPADAITVQSVGSNKYKITLDPWLVSTGKNFEICARITVSDSEGHTEEWEPRVWVDRGEDRQRAGMDIDHEWVEFFAQNGITKAMTHVDTGMKYEWGDVVHSLVEVDLPSGVSYDLPTNTLTLNNAKLQNLQVGYSWYDTNTGDSGTQLPNENFTIKLVGNNTIEGDDEDILGLGDEVKATITGTGTLNIKGKCNDPYGWGPVLNMWNGAELVIDGGTVNVNAEMVNPADDNWPVAMNVDRGTKLTVNGGKLNLNAKNFRTALMLNGDYTQNGGKVTVTAENEKAGLHLNADGRVDNYGAYAISSKGYTTINGGSLTADGYFGLEIGYDSGDPNNPNWPAQPNTKFTLNDGTVTAKGDFRGVEIYAPAELKGGSMKASISSVYNPMANINVGQALIVWDNGSEDVKAYLEISGGEHTFTASTGANTVDYGAVADSADIFFTGGTSTFKGVKAIAGQSMLADNKDLLEIADNMDIYDKSAKICKQILKGEYLLKEPDFQQLFYINSIETDDIFDAQKWWDGEADECGEIMITVHLEQAVSGKAATCTATGLTDGKKCQLCGKTLVAQQTIPVKGHTEVKVPAKAATCTATGLTEGKKCSVCGVVIVAQKTVPQKGHTYDDNVDGQCNVCGVNRENVETRQVTHMFRMYNPNTGEHFYTGSEVERSNLVAVGWNYEGVGFTFPANTGAPVYRLFHEPTGEHLYTMDEAEKAKLEAEGWNYEGIAFNSAYDTEAVQHRLHNPNATVGAYHFTFSLEEKQTLIDAGWEYQGIGWYSCWK